MVNPKPKLLPPIRANAGLEADYRQAMQTLIVRMADSYAHHLKAAWRKNPPASRIAMDASPVRDLNRTLKALGKQWQSKFNDLSDKWGGRLADKSLNSFDASFKSALKNAGFTVQLRGSAALTEGLASIVTENVALIRNIPQKYYAQIESQLFQSIRSGHDLATFSQGLQKKYHMTYKRAKLIANDQTNKAKAVIEAKRREQLGITEAIWVHGGGVKEPRHSHLEAGRDKLRFDVSKGAYLDGKWVLPGEEINCLPGYSEIEFSTGCKKLWRRRYSGYLTKIITSSGKTINATPNHPILTNRGWVPIQSVNIGDNVISIADEVFDSIEANVKGNKSTFDEIFNSISFYVRPISSVGSAFQFHSDGSNGEIETINIDSFLPDELDTSICQKFCEIFFSNADHIFIPASGFYSDSAIYSTCMRLFRSPEGVIRGFCLVLSFLKSSSYVSGASSLLYSAYLNACINQASSYDVTGNGIHFRKLKLTTAGLVRGDNQVIGELFNMLSRASVGWQFNAPSADELGNSCGVNLDDFGGLQNTHAGIQALDSVVNTGRINFDGHVYNLENEVSWYSSNTYIIHNCSCTSYSIIPGLD